MSHNGKPDAPLNIQQPRHRRAYFIKAGLLGLSLCAFIGAAAVAVIPGPPDPVIYQTQQTLALPTEITVLETDSEQSYLAETRIRRGDTLAALLQRLNINEPGLLQFLTVNESARSIYKLYPGRSLQASLDADQNLQWLRYNHTPYKEQAGDASASWLHISPDGNGGFTAQELQDTPAPRLRLAKGEINSSLFGATDAQQIPDGITVQMAEILGSKIDFIKDLRKGDTFEVLYESYTHEGQEVGAGRLLAVEFVNQGKTYQAAWFKPDDGAGSYYDFSGSSLRGAFLRTALKFSRISSTFGSRRHPIHGRWTDHKGVDYAAPTGTPIHATADGTIEFIGTQRGYGNVIVLEHHGQYSTLYAHQSRFAAGLRKGTKVEQGQLIGYVGSTGWATGPHLHYEFRINNKPVDPLSVDLPVHRSLEAKQKQEFTRMIASYRDTLSLLHAPDKTTLLAQR